MARDKAKLKARILDSTAMQRALNRIAHEILERNSRVDELVLIGIYARGVPLAQRLSQIIKGIEGKTVSLGTLAIELHHNGSAPLTPEFLAGRTHIPCSLSDKIVILVDDLLYTGRTARAALDALNDFGTPKMIQLAVLIDRGHRELPIHADYVGKNVPTASNEIVHIRLKEIDNEEHVIILE